MSDTSASPVARKPSCPCLGVTLTKLIQPTILSILSDGPLHGYRIVASAAAIPTARGGRPDSTGIYRTLHAMQRRGLVVSAWDASGTGPARRTYELTDDGRECLGKWIETLARYRATIDALLGAARKAARGGARRKRKAAATAGPR